jgi:hypothetical protein
MLYFLRNFGDGRQHQEHKPHPSHGWGRRFNPYRAHHWRGDVPVTAAAGYSAPLSTDASLTKR